MLLGRGELKSLRSQSVSEVRLVMLAIFRICEDECQLGLQKVEKLATLLNVDVDDCDDYGHWCFTPISCFFFFSEVS